MTSPDIQLRNSIVPVGTSEWKIDKQFINDDEFHYINNVKNYAVPRKKAQSEFIINALNQVGEAEGF